MGLKAAGAVKAMQTGLLSGNTWIGVLTASGEVNVAGYAREPMTASDWENTSPAGNEGALDFFEPSADDNEALTKLALYDASSGGSMLMDGDLTSGAVTLQAAANITANDDAITVNITGGGLTAQGNLVCLKGGLLGNSSRHMSLHSSEPLNGDNVEHELSGGDYSRVTVVNSGWATHASNVANPGRLKNVNAITWPTPNAAWAQPTHVGFYDASLGGNLLYYDIVDAAVAAPAIGATVTIGAEAFYIDLEID